MPSESRESIPVQIISPWLADNEEFIKELKARSTTLERATDLRSSLALRKMVAASPCALEGVDASVVSVPIGDLITILVQAVRVKDTNEVTCRKPVRVSGVNSYELSKLCVPLRMREECAELAQSKTITIADNSFWSMLMEVNQLITLKHTSGSGIIELTQVYNQLVKDGTFLEMLRNPAVIAMSKHNQSCVHSGGNKMVSDRELLGRALEPGEFTIPTSLASATGARFGSASSVDDLFGVERRGFNDNEYKEVRAIYKSQLGVIFYKPHPWSRAYRIEAHLNRLNDDAWLMPLLNGIAKGTEARTSEPWPQFLADYATKRISSVANLYGERNISRVPYFDPVRTIR